MLRRAIAAISILSAVLILASITLLTAAPADPPCPVHAAAHCSISSLKSVGFVLGVGAFLGFLLLLVLLCAGFIRATLTGGSARD